jgi:hypothetical protein
MRWPPDWPPDWRAATWLIWAAGEGALTLLLARFART